MGFGAAPALAASGDLDTSFSGDGKLTTGFTNGALDDHGEAVAVKANGTVVVAGTSNQGSATSTQFALARYKPDGSPAKCCPTPPTYGFNNGAQPDSAHAVAIQADGKIVVAGESDYVVGPRRITRFAIARHHPGGALDESFSVDGKLTTWFPNSSESRARGIAIQGNGKIVVAGYSREPGGERFAIARYNANGSLDTSFSADGRQLIGFKDAASFSDRAEAVTIQNDGKIVVAGASSQEKSTNNCSVNHFALARLDPDGKLDRTFSTDGKRLTTFPKFCHAHSVAFDVARAVGTQVNGKIVAVGWSSTTDCFCTGKFAIARYKPNGSLDTSFSNDGRRTTIFPFEGQALGAIGESVAIQGDGKIVAGGWTFRDHHSEDPAFAVARYHPSGALDKSFSFDGRQTTAFGDGWNQGRAIAIGPQGGIVVAGASYQGTGEGRQFAVARYLP